MSILNLRSNAIGEMAVAPLYKGDELENPMLLKGTKKVNPSTYVLSKDGKTLARWDDETTEVLDMEADPILRNIEVIGREVFEDHPNLKTIVFPKGLKEIGFRSFKGTKITSIILPENIENIGVSSFMQTLIKEVELMENVKLIGGNFINETDVENLRVPKDTYVGGASMNNKKLKSLSMEATTPPNTFLDKTLFSELEEVCVPKDSVDRYKRHWDWKKFSDIIKEL